MIALEPHSENSTKRTLRPFLIDILRQNWAPMALGALLSLLAALAAIGLLSLSSWFLAASAYAGLNMATAKAFNFFLPSIGVRLFAMIRTLARYGERIVSHDATFRILETLRGWSYRRLEPLVPAPLNRHHSADLLTRFITDIDTLDNLYLRVLSPTVVAVVTTAMLVGFMAAIYPLIALCAAGAFMFAGMVLPLMADRMAREAARRLNRQTARLRTHIADGLHGLAALLACDAHTAYLERLEDRHRHLVRSQGKMSGITGLTAALMTLAGGAAVCGTLYIGTQAVADGSLSGPMLAMLTLAAMAGFEIVGTLPHAYQYLGQTRKAAARLREVTRPMPVVTFPTQGKPMTTDIHIEFDQVDFKYAGSRKPAVKHLSFQIPYGSNMAVMGASGAGKSTLVYLLSRFEDPTGGIIRLAHRPLAEFTEETLRNTVCIIDQRAYIFNGTLRDNLLIANPRADEAELLNAIAAVRLQTFVEGLPKGLDTWVGEAGRLLSGGQARRLSVARAVLSPAPVWVLDEPTEGLDTDTANAMLAALLNLGMKKTIVMITHRAEAVERMDQVVLMDQGRLVAVDSPARLKAGNAHFNELMRGA